MSADAAPHPPRVAVIVPCYNDGVTLEATVASIDDNEPMELVVMDDGSVGPLHLPMLERLEADGVRVVHHGHNRGLIEARMTGLAATCAPLVLPLDADDCPVPGAGAKMADALEADPGAVACFGDYQEFGESNLMRAVPQ